MNTRMDIQASSAVFDDGPVIDTNNSDAPPIERALNSLRNFASLSEGLRILGAAVLLTSMSVFLLQGWSEGNDISRYLLLLTQTGLLALAGFLLSYGLKETKGARLFFGLALVSIPANFTILSALLYSVVQWDGGLVESYPAYASWIISDLSNIGLTAAGAMLLLVPVTLFCYAIMARHSSKVLTVNYLLLNALLLLPMRTTAAVGLVAIAGTLYALHLSGKLARQDGALRTFEGRFALSTLFIPTGVMLFRSIYFYQIDSLLIAMLSLTAFAMLRQASIFPERNRRIAFLLDTLSLPVALLAGVSMVDVLNPVITWEFQAPVFALIFGFLGLDIIRRTSSRTLASFTGFCISSLTFLSFLFAVSLSPNGLSALLCLVAGATLAAVGHATHSRVAIFCGLLTILAGLVFGTEEFVKMILSSSWIDLAIFGAAAIALGSVLDRHGAALKVRAGNWFNAIRFDQRAAQESDQDCSQMLADRQG